MKKYIHSCFLAFICLYRSKQAGLQKQSECQLENTPFPTLTQSAYSSWLHHYLFNKPVITAPQDYHRFRAVVYLGAYYPGTLNSLLNMASLSLTFQNAVNPHRSTLPKNLSKQLSIKNSSRPIHSLGSNI